MSLKDQQNLLAKLYTDAEFRRAFLSEPEKIGAENDLTEKEISEIAAIMPEELNFFADSLYWKRLRAVEKLLPLTRQVLDEDFARIFLDFSQTYNPQTIKKHLEDAHKFCRFLQSRNISDVAKTAAKFERSKLEFFGFEKRLVICRVGFDIREFIVKRQKSPFEIPEKKAKTAVWFRFGKRVKHFFI